MPKISVIIPNYNNANYITCAIESVLSQTYTDFEILVVDDGSTDNSKGAIGKYILKHCNKMRYFYQENKGLSVARNKGIKESRGSYITFLDSDDEWKPTKLERQMKLIEKEDADFVHCAARIKYDDAISDEIKPKFPAYNFYDLLLTKKSVVTSTVLLKKACFDNAGLFDEEIKSAEDYELWLRMFFKYKIGYIDEPLAIYRKHSGNFSSNNQELMRKEGVKIFQNLQKNSGFSKGLIRKKLSGDHYKLGKFYYKNKKYRKAFTEVKNAIIVYPFVGLIFVTPLEKLSKQVIIFLKPFAFLLLLSVLCIIKRR